MSILKESARPDYWTPDEECINCSNCDKPFDTESSRTSSEPTSGFKVGSVHHCRSCGGGVCDNCSQGRQRVPHKGWDHPVRICDKCST
ncbi:Uncharacterized protein FKW44_001599 [Caligus rogercresseyi]|uniref:FYVE-type domain-containing protein n=1 Tax=Caligus rogercresseyi TaxID=217165 RepID=A0A7T8QVP2_CALRO|nr:Uncharacterized protein FKW44_001599 [Caligus rogercresseyi]